MFKDKIAVITGGSSGLGLELARRLKQKGAKLALIARNPEKLEQVKKELEAMGPPSPLAVFSCRVEDFGAVEAAMEKIAEELGPPDLLINSAGVLREAYFERQSLETFRELMEINFFGTLHCTKAVLPFFKKKGGGRLVNISSMAGLAGVFGYSGYCASKHAVAGLTHTLRIEFKPQNIKVHLVCPPEFESPMVDEINTYRSPENRALAHLVPVLTAEQVADEVMKGIAKERYLIIPGRAVRMMEFMNRMFPGLSRVVVDIALKRVYRGPEAE